MEGIFKLPIKSILRKKANRDYNYHYTYYSGNKDCEIVISLFDDCLDVSLWNRIDDKGTSWNIKRINNATLDKLQERINNYLEKIKWEQSFYNSWELLIKKNENSLLTEDLTEGQKQFTLNAIESYKRYIMDEDEE